jgi:hypothetical protein
MSKDNYIDGTITQPCINTGEKTYRSKKCVNLFPEGEIINSSISQGHKKFIVQSARRSESKESGDTFFSFRKSSI